MLCARARPLFSSPFSLTFSAAKHSPSLLRLPCQRSVSAVAAMSSSSTPEIIEHIVLFKVKDDADSGNVTAMLNGLNALVSLDSVVHLAAGPIHRPRSAFTHVLHSRYKSKDDLGVYTAHPDHLRVVKESVLPNCDDIMAVDWVADRVPGTLVPPPGSAAKVTFLKLKENVSDEAKSEILDVIKGLDEKLPGIDQITVGENFSPARAKGFSIASIAYFGDLGRLEALEAQQDLVNLQKEKARDLLDGVMVVDYVVPSPSSL
ncbi:PREDICTED: stress-response A/B barrel domain-containing protein UP3 [Tarenaya hassleriana]|uniref:stress-response A/B barrel domain-containing protein UP3 n=1 Tax=Tarenaya hassleriana TaxID=28532 RepID=UPI00053C84FC|nr:PREDICTED: stress-response A/B barrel domain-containing protein UP3 [Tarenaya hassleriana]